jgi:hypothetical protein
MDASKIRVGQYTLKFLEDGALDDYRHANFHILEFPDIA